MTRHQEAANIAHARAGRGPLNWVDCAECGGQGAVYLAYPALQATQCPECHGSGSHEWACNKCGNAIPADYTDCLVCDFIGSLPATFGIAYDGDFAKQVADLLWAEANRERK